MKRFATVTGLSLLAIFNAPSAKADDQTGIAPSPTTQHFVSGSWKPSQARRSSRFAKRAHRAPKYASRVAKRSPRKTATHKHETREASHSTRGGLAVVRSKSGATALVARSVASKFQALIHDLESAGARISFMGGFARRRVAGTGRWSKHASGYAIDICQTARNRVACRLPRGATQIAARHGLLHGAVWSSPDAGHFEVGSLRSYASAKRTRHASRKRGNKKYAQASSF